MWDTGMTNLDTHHLSLDDTGSRHPSGRGPRLWWRPAPPSSLAEGRGTKVDTIRQPRKRGNK